MKKTYLDVVNLASGHSLIMGRTPKVLSIDQICNALDKQHHTVSSFGLFDTAQPNFSNYYPDVKPEDLEPKDEDYVYPLFRALSEVTVHKNWNPIDFSKPGILKDSMHKLTGQTVYPNHEPTVGNELGVVTEVFWEKEKVVDGVTIPAGINMRLKIDGKSNPKVARGLMSDPPSIHSNSVTVAFKWEKSHELEDQEFYSKLGTYDKDGEMIRRVVTEVVRFTETSLVAHGADPFAQIIRDGKINNPTFADVSYNSETGHKPLVYFDYKEDLTNLAERTIPQNTNNESQNGNTMNKHLLALAAILGLTASDFTTEEALAEAVTPAIQDLVNLKATNADNATKLADLQTKLTTANNDLTSLKETSKEGTAALTAVRELAVASYKQSLAEGAQPVQAIVDQINNGTYEAVNALKATYDGIVENKMPLTCQSCKGTDVSRQSSQSDTGINGGDNSGGQSSSHTTLSNDDTIEQLRKSTKRFINHNGLQEKAQK